MGEWGYRPEFGESRTAGKRPAPCSSVNLTGVVKLLSPAAKQAMFAAASKGIIKRRTWDGCAFNQAGQVNSKAISSATAAARAFGMSVGDVQQFISCWDGQVGSDKDVTQRLRTTIEEVGLFTEPKDFLTPVARTKKVFRQTIYKSQETRMREEFERLMKENKVELVAEAESILVGAPSA